MKPRNLTLAALLAIALYGQAQPSGGVTWNNALRQQPAWYGTSEAIRIADNLLVYQHDNGAWDKNIDMAAPLEQAKRSELIRAKSGTLTTIDNGATYTQLRYLARAFTSTGQQRFSAAFHRGLDYLLRAQYANGGWPQYYPLRDGYWRYITYNDDAMVNVMTLLRSIGNQESGFAFLSAEQRDRSRQAVRKGIECILKTQVTVNGKLTVWCAQHDEKTLLPAKARSYEHPSLSGSESVGIVRFLMSIDQPSPEIIRSIQSAIDWFNASKITGLRLTRQPAPGTASGTDTVVTPDPAAPPLWARFYDIATNRPIFSGRDGVIKATMAEIEYERRNGYRWYVTSAAELLDRDYPAWQRKR